MVRKTIYKSLAALLLMAVVSSCGAGSDGNLGGNVTQFKHSYATAVSATGRLEADIITGNTCTAGSTTGGTITTESVDITVNVVKTNTSSAPTMPVSITGWTVYFTPKNAGIPALAPITSSFGNPVIDPGSSVTISVPIITDIMKVNLLTADPSIPCSLAIFQYDVSVRFHAAEVGSGDSSKDIVAGLVLAIADRSQ